MTDIYSGDPKITLGPDGADFVYIGGQPVMDQGVENLALLSLFTEDVDPVSGFTWPGNVFFSDEQKVGSGFVRQARQPQTLKQLAITADAGVKALENKAFGKITAAVTNPVSDYVEAKFVIGQGSLNVTGNQASWAAQIQSPAYLRSGNG